MMKRNEAERAFYVLREARERHMAREVDDEAVARPHRELAELYAERIRLIDLEVDGLTIVALDGTASAPLDATGTLGERSPLVATNGNDPA